ncbi:MAG: methyltransferase domain-containing protein [Planctomycetes bacterium]|nr:methyltransferase domain-containing protein [Planctomycetota bacterium]
MDTWKYYDITHRDLDIMNPVSSAALDGIVALLDLPRGAAVLDIGCGKAEFLVRLAEKYGIAGTGVDISPFCIRDARDRARRRVPGAALTFVEADGAAFPVSPDSLDLASCFGASWIFKGHRGTLRALARRVRAGGLVLVAEPFWRRPPDPAHLAAESMSATDFESHAGNVAAGIAEGLTPLFATATAEVDWDRYEGLQWNAAERYAQEHPEDPDVPELLKRTRQSRDNFLRWGRDTFGDGIYLFRK